MKAIHISRYSGPEVFERVEVPTLGPAPPSARPRSWRHPCRYADARELLCDDAALPSVSAGRPPT